MKGGRELKRLIAKKRRRWAGKNGVIPAFAFDDLRLVKLARAIRKGEE